MWGQIINPAEAHWSLFHVDERNRKLARHNPTYYCGDETEQKQQSAVAALPTNEMSWRATRLHRELANSISSDVRSSAQLATRNTTKMAPNESNPNSDQQLHCGESPDEVPNPRRRPSSKKTLAWLAFTASTIAIVALLITNPFTVGHGHQGDVPDGRLVEAKLEAVDWSKLDLSRRPREDRIAPTEDPDGSRVERTILHCPDGECLLQHYPKSFSPIYDLSEVKGKDFAEIYFLKNDPWYEGFKSKLSPSTFNCCAFAVAPFVGLTPHDFLDVEPSQGFPNPTQVILNSYFQRVKAYPTLADALREFSTDTELRQDDVICVLDSSTSIFQHAGRVHVESGLNRVLSKCGLHGPIVLSDLQFLARLFPGDVVHVYRFRN